MRWLTAELFRMVATGERDRLGNPRRASTSMGTVRVRVAPWGAVPTENDGNDYSATTLTLVTTAPLSKVRGAETLTCSAGGEFAAYAVTGISDLGRRRAISCSRTKGV